MSWRFEELDDTTRERMVAEFEAELAGGNPYMPKALTALGRQRFPQLMRAALSVGSEATLRAALEDSALWGASVSINAERAAVTEFNIWYIRGFSARLLAEHVDSCQLYRAAVPRKSPSADCSRHEGAIYGVQAVYDGHRRKYWPQVDKTAFMLPSHPLCHHTIRRAS